MAVAGRLAMRG